MIRHVSSIAEIVEDVDAAVMFYESLGLEVKREMPGYAIVQNLPGILHFGIWSRADAAEATFGDRTAVGRIPLGFTVGFEVDDVESGAGKLGDTVLQAAKTETWGQKTVRYRSPSGAVCELSEAPWARELETNVTAKNGDVTAS